MMCDYYLQTWYKRVTEQLKILKIGKYQESV